MGSHSRCRVTRSKAIRFLIQTIMSADDDRLRELMDIEMDARLRRVEIVDDTAENDDWEVN